MKRIYGCDVWDGLCSTFNRVVVKPAVALIKGAGTLIATGANNSGIVKTWDALTGKSLLPREYTIDGRLRHEMYIENTVVCRFLGATTGLLASYPVVHALGVEDSVKATIAVAAASASALLGAAVSTLPRNAYVACKLQKKYG